MSTQKNSCNGLPPWVWPAVCIGVSYGTSLLSSSQHYAVVGMFGITVGALVCLELIKSSRNPKPDSLPPTDPVTEYSTADTRAEKSMTQPIQTPKKMIATNVTNQNTTTQLNPSNIREFFPMTHLYTGPADYTLENRPSLWTPPGSNQLEAWEALQGTEFQYSHNPMGSVQQAPSNNITLAQQNALSVQQGTTYYSKANLPSSTAKTTSSTRFGTESSSDGSERKFSNMFVDSELQVRRSLDYGESRDKAQPATSEPPGLVLLSEEKGDTAQKDLQKEKSPGNHQYVPPLPSAPPAKRKKIQSQQDVVEDITTLMVRHLPCKLTFQELTDTLEHHGFSKDTYDFLYLPQDLINNTNRGYAFINMCPLSSPSDNSSRALVGKFRSTFCRYQFHKKSSKMAHVVNAHLQGFQSLYDHFHRTVVKKHKNCIYMRETAVEGCVKSAM